MRNKILIFILFVIPLSYLFFDYNQKLLMPRSYYFNYDSITSSKEVFEVGEDIYFISKSEINRSFPMQWEDILYCKNEDGVKKYYSVYYSGKNNPKIKNLEEIKWRYGAYVPKKKSECYLEANIKMNVGYEIIKSQIVESNNFKIK